MEAAQSELIRGEDTSPSSAKVTAASSAVLGYGIGYAAHRYGTEVVLSYEDQS